MKKEKKNYKEKNKKQRGQKRNEQNDCMNGIENAKQKKRQ